MQSNREKQYKLISLRTADTEYVYYSIYNLLKKEKSYPFSSKLAILTRFKNRKLAQQFSYENIPSIGDCVDYYEFDSIEELERDYPELFL